jgi:hypothetical protein
MGKWLFSKKSRLKFVYNQIVNFFQKKTSNVLQCMFFHLFLRHTQSKLTNRKMKKITFALAACAALTFAACGNNATETTTTDSTATETTTEETTTEADSTATEADSTATTTEEAPATDEAPATAE